MRYVIAKCNEKHKDVIYRIFISDVLSYVAENTARMSGQGGKYTTANLRDILAPTKVKRKETKVDALEMARSLSDKMGLVIKNE